MHPVNSLSGNAAYSIILLCLERHIILLCLTPDNFTRQGESAVTQCVKFFCPYDSIQLKNRDQECDRKRQGPRAQIRRTNVLLSYRKGFLAISFKYYVNFFVNTQKN